MKPDQVFSNPIMQTSDEQLKSEADPPKPVFKRSGSLSRKRNAIIGACIVAVIPLVWLGVQGLGLMKPKVVKESAPSPVLTVSVVNPAIKPVEKQIEVNGSISAWDPIELGSQVSGLEVKSVLVEEGDQVRKGQLLATLDSSVLVPQLDSERARLHAAIASARKAVQPNRPEDINSLAAAVSQAEATVAEQQAALAQAQASLTDAATNVQRYDLLSRQGAVSKQDFDTRQMNAKVGDALVHSAEQRLAAAKFALRQAKERLSMARVGGRSEDIQIANANVDEIRANVQKLEAQIAQTYIKAPVDGLITRRDAHIGDIVNAGKSMFQIARDDRLELRAQLAESDLAFMKKSEPVAIKCAVLGDKVIIGTVRQVSPAIDPNTRLATVRIDIPATSGVQPGMFAEGRINVGKYSAFAVPSKCVIMQDDKPMVFVLSPGNKVQVRLVTTGVRAVDLVEIKSGLTAQDLVVTDGAGFLKDGDYVAVSK